MTPSQRRTLLLGIAALIVVGGGYVFYLRPTLTPRPELDSLNAPAASNERPRPGGLIVATVRAEPRTFNRYVVGDATNAAIAALIHARLVRVNQQTQQLEPWLAERWETTDSLRYVLHLRPDVKFSDGTPFTSADVVFSFTALYDPKADSVLASAYKIDGKPIAVQAIDDHTIAITFPAPFGPGLRLLDSLPILPKHRLEASVANGTFRNAWGVTTPPNEIVGLGPFKFHLYLPGERVEFERNPNYWRTDSAGTKLPYVDRVALEIVPNQSAEMLRLESGTVDLVSSELRPDDVPAFRRMATQKRVKMADLGPGLDVDYFWFNLKPDGPSAHATDGAPARPWLARRELRQAISYAIDRHEFVNTVLLGAGTPVYGPVTPANKDWFAADLPTTPHDVAKARELLASIGLTDRNNDGMLEASDGTPARFALFTQKGRPLRERATAFLKEDLKKIGLDVQVTALETPALVDRLMKGNYDAAFFGVSASDTDPGGNLDLWLSSGSFHVWNIGQEKPATAWEAQIDELMRRQMQATDQNERKRLFREVQVIVNTELPVICFAAPNVLIATSSRVINAHPALLQPQILWSPDDLGMIPEPQTLPR
jgi:peptide/nickel transport system substrate-binding protein